jgi:hypothetical protein
MWFWLREHVTIWVILGALAVAGGLIVLLALLFLLAPQPAQSASQPLAELTVIPAPTMTPTKNKPTPNPNSTVGVNGQIVDGIGIGMFVQISGTGGDGLRLRVGPSTNDDPRFLGYEAEVFKVKDGPKLADGYTWWFLEAPYDPGRSGWAASKYLSVVSITPEPSGTPAP